MESIRSTRECMMRNKAKHLVLCVFTATALIANAPLAAADDTDPTPGVPPGGPNSISVSPTTKVDFLPDCFPGNDVRSAAQAGDVQSACNS